MRTAKIIGLGLFFSLVGFTIVIAFSTMRHGIEFDSSHATGLSATLGGILEALINPMTWVIVVVAFFAAVWVTRPKRSTT